MDYNLDQWKVAEEAVEHGERVLLYGMPGTGKTTTAALHALNGRNVYTVTMTEETPAEALRGHYITDGVGGLRWMHGTGVCAWVDGARLVINEIDKACGDAMDLLHVICDDQSVAELTLPNADQTKVRPAEGFQIIATMNGLPESLPEAVQDRFAVQVPIDSVHPKAIESLPVDLQEVARRAANVQNEQRRIGIRKFKAYASLRFKTTEEVAAQAVFGKPWRSIISQFEIVQEVERSYTVDPTDCTICDDYSCDCHNEHDCEER